MNKDLRYHYRCDNWNSTEFLLQYLRKRDVFKNGFTGRTDANPYWYGSVVEPEKLIQEIKALVAAKSIKPSRLIKVFEAMEQDLMSPVVVFTGWMGKRETEKLSNVQ